jgi:hypothetical protein
MRCKLFTINMIIQYRSPGETLRPVRHARDDFLIS